MRGACEMCARNAYPLAKARVESNPHRRHRKLRKVETEAQVSLVNNISLNSSKNFSICNFGCRAFQLQSHTREEPITSRFFPFQPGLEYGLSLSEVSNLHNFGCLGMRLRGIAAASKLR